MTYQRGAAWHAAYTAMRTAHHLPTESDSPERAHASRTDYASPANRPSGSSSPSTRTTTKSSGSLRLSCATTSGSCRFWRVPLRQNHDGQALLDAALATEDMPRPDSFFAPVTLGPPAAIRGPASTCIPRSRRGAVSTGVGFPRRHYRREGAATDADFAADLDDCFGVGSHGPDLERLLGEGCRFLVKRDSGYAVAREQGSSLLPLTISLRLNSLRCAAAAETDEVVEVS